MVRFEGLIAVLLSKGAWGRPPVQAQSNVWVGKSRLSPRLQKSLFTIVNMLRSKIIEIVNIVYM